MSEHLPCFLDDDCRDFFVFDQLVEARDIRGDDAVEFWDLTNREDWRISELSQAGIQSRAYTPGPYSTREELLCAFDETVLDRERRSK